MEDTTSAKRILERLRQGTGAKSDSELGRMVGVSQQAIYNARNGNKLPDAWVRRAAQQFNLSADWLYFGDGHMYRGTGADKASSGLEKDINRDVLLDVVEVMEESLRAAKKNLPPKAKAELVYQLYHLVIENEAADGPQTVRMFKLIQGALAVNE